MKIIYTILFVIILAVVSSCVETAPIPEDVIETPVAATLVFPENNTNCQEGTILNDNQSKIVFKWGEAENADSYILHLKNLNTNLSSEEASINNELEITLERGVSFSWYVVAMANGTDETAESDVWKFYNAGLASVSHAPFPADVVSPENGITVSSGSGNVLLQWEADDIDEDIVSYKIFLGEQNPPLEEIGITVDKELMVNVISGNTYYWYVITEDTVENQSKSDIFSFKIE